MASEPYSSDSPIDRVTDQSMDRAQDRARPVHARLVAPMFRQPNDKNVVLFAEDIGGIHIYRQIGPPGRTKRIRVARSEMEDEAGQTFEYIPSVTDEPDIGEWFGPGEYFVQAYNALDNRILPCAHTVTIPGQLREGIYDFYMGTTPQSQGRRVPAPRAPVGGPNGGGPRYDERTGRRGGGQYAPDADDGYDEGGGYSPQQGSAMTHGYDPGGQYEAEAPDPQVAILAKMIETQEKTMLALKDANDKLVAQTQSAGTQRGNDAMTFAKEITGLATRGQVAGSETRDETVAELRRTLDEMRREHARAIEKLDAKHDEELRVFKRRAESEADEFVAKRRTHEAELASMRDAHREALTEASRALNALRTSSQDELSKERDRSAEAVRDLRKANERECDELRNRRKTDEDELRLRFSGRISELESQLALARTGGDQAMNALRDRLEKRVQFLENENIKLRQDLAEAPLPPEPPPPPPANANAAMPADAPWWAGLLPAAFDAMKDLAKNAPRTGPGSLQGVTAEQLASQNQSPPQQGADPYVMVHEAQQRENALRQQLAQQQAMLVQQQELALQQERQRVALQQQERLAQEQALRGRSGPAAVAGPPIAQAVASPTSPNAAPQAAAQNEAQRQAALAELARLQQLAEHAEQVRLQTARQAVERATAPADPSPPVVAPLAPSVPAVQPAPMTTDAAMPTPQPAPAVARPRINYGPGIMISTSGPAAPVAALSGATTPS